MPVKYVFVTGGVVSGLGKGITAASLGRLLKARGYPIASFMTCFMCSPSSLAVLPIAALLTLSLPVFAGKKYRPESCFSNGSAKAGLRPRWNIQNQLASVGYFQQSKDGGQFFHPPSSEGEVRPLGRHCGTGKSPCPSSI